MQSEYGIDVGDDALMSSRSWRWMKARVLGLLAVDSRTARHFAPEPIREPQMR